MSAPFISVLTGPGSEFLGIRFPSGQITPGEPGSSLLAFLIAMRATFGFNAEPHTFELDWIPSGTGYGHGASGNLPAINTELEMQISGFYLKGNITHVDWDSSSNGTVLNMVLKDKRTTLDQYKVTTDDLGEDVPSGVVSISREFRLMYGITQSTSRVWPARGVTKTEIEANDLNYIEYSRIIEFGATYPQILSAIMNRLGSGVADKLPPVASIAPNIGTDINSLRFRFNLENLRSMLDTVTLDTSFEWYWNMHSETVALINKKTPFTIPEDRIISIIDGFGGSGIENVTGISYGIDKVTDATKIVLLGAQQEGMMNSKLLSPIDGLDTIYTGASGSGLLLFEAAWALLTVGYYDADGFYRTYVPSEKELQMALAGIEQWTYFKKYQTSPSPSGWDLPSDIGHISAQHPDFQSRLDPRQPIAEILTNPDTNIRVINNRRDLDSNWVIEYFTRVNQHAQRHYGKSYIATHALTRDDRVFGIVDEAWCNIENQRQDPSLPFTEDYEIDRRYGPFAPFYSPRTNKVRAHCVLPSGTVYGPLGEDSPVSFMEWTEDAFPFNPSGNGEHYIPVDLAIVGSRVMDPRNEESFSFESFPENTVWCQLPALAGSGIEQDDILGNLATLTELGLQIGQSGIIDLIDPTQVVIPYTYLSGVAIPVISNLRYGRTFPTTWASGTSDPIRGDDVIIDEILAPWTEYPENDDSSIDKLNRRAFDTINARITSQNNSQYVNISQVGLPRISFDTFAIQTANISGLVGEREHGVNEVNLNYGAGGLTTNYRAQSYFSTPRTPGPLDYRTRARLEGVIQPIDYTELGDFLTNFGKGDPNVGAPIEPFNSHQMINFDFERQEACTVIAINNIFDQDTAEIFLHGHDVEVEERYFVQVDRKRGFVFSQTNVTFEMGTNTFGHTLNSLQVVTVVSPNDNTINTDDILSTELDPHSVIVQNNTGQVFTGTLMIFNREGVIRPTQGTIRRGIDVTWQGVVCNDGYLNLYDKCVYLHKRVDGEEMAFLTGGRKFNAGSIVTVESQEDDGSYNVSIYGDPHGRWIVGVDSLNDVVLETGLQAPVEASTNASVRPGPEASGFIIIPTATGGGGVAVRLTTITGLGTSGAYATVTQLEASGINGATTYSGVYILPYPHFAQSGDLGIMASYTGASGTLRYVDVNKTGFLTYI